MLVLVYHVGIDMSCPWSGKEKQYRESWLIQLRLSLPGEDAAGREREYDGWVSQTSWIYI
jgi:hypothetical protein